MGMKITLDLDFDAINETTLKAYMAHLAQYNLRIEQIIEHILLSELDIYYEPEYRDIDREHSKDYEYLKLWWDQNMKVWFNLNFEREYKDFKTDLDKIFNKDFIKFLEQASKKPVRG